MSATSGIQVSPDLQAAFTTALDSQTTRFLKISISSESLVHDSSTPVQGDLLDDLPQLQRLLEDDVPAYVLTRLDSPPTDWLAVFYVPETAKIRDKMLYASTRSSLLKSLGSQTFVDQIFATTKADLTPDAYKSHRRHLEAPKPLSKQEQELEDVKAAEREGGLNAYEGSSVRRNNVGRVDVVWSSQVEDALKMLAEGEGSYLVILGIDSNESMVLHSAQEVAADDVGKTLPQSEICFAFFAWPAARGGSDREIVYIYSCPSTSSVKLRMLYSVSSRALYTAVQTFFQSMGTTATLASRKVETSDPQEIDEKFLISELGPASAEDASGASTPVVEEQKRFARPKGPGRKR